MPTSASSSDIRAMGSSTPVENAGSTGSGEGGVEMGVDPASHNFFSPDYRNSRHEDLRQMLEGNKDPQKLEAMKRIIGMRGGLMVWHMSCFRFIVSTFKISKESNI